MTVHAVAGTGPESPGEALIFPRLFCFADWINNRYLAENIKDSFQNSEKIIWHGCSVVNEVAGKVTMRR